MKSALLFFFGCLLYTATCAQSFRINRLPDEGQLLDTYWRWQAGDNPAWADPNFDARRWDTIPVYPTVAQLTEYKQKGIGWARLRLQVDSSVAARALSLRVFERWAADVYVDGRLIHRFGQIDGQGKIRQKHLSPQGEYVQLPNLSAGLHTLALRLARKPLAWYMPSRLDRVGSVFSVRLVPTDGLTWRVTRRTHWDAVNNYWLLGFFLALATIHLLYYIYRRKRINLIFSLSMFFGVLWFVMANLTRYSTDSVWAEWATLFSALMLTLYFSSLLLTYYLHLHQRPHWLFWLTAGVMLTNVFISSYTPLDLTAYIFPWGIAILLTLGMVLSIRAIKRKIADGWIVMGSLAILITILTSQLVINVLLGAWVASNANTINQLIDNIFFMTAPLTLALLLARENAQTNQQLTQHLAEVKQLSAEKEEILTRQKVLLEQQVAERTQALSQSLDELRTTQQQLVQREKMASLGELTAGIAHEIQNPLNFVNNFAEVSLELAQELGDERTRSNRDEALEAELLTDLTQNLEKIGHHGKRASNIVRGMLEHSRSSSGERQPTDLNALADEYLRLSYHGLRAKDKSFNAKLVTEFDPALPPLSVVGQDIGRVLLNLFNNAFYAVQERARQDQVGYEPTVSVKTEQSANRVSIRVSDNGMGIPAAVREKIFQPFFTTKPTGQGTGLGLSLSYDIISKGHAGTLRVESEEGAGTTFMIELPTKTSVTGN
ncbi:Signal transduction histidine-protein kinase atoS [Fibrella aestuarina BUZ 2]|uniref:histidine kinase n=1 Tax=Fibrella aestuarina BUZ 2 TaxID=1166018 RepID=I0K378_9BACT|nr:ATP-binding protein [Fibrella aestuarina]CCG98581.1 Signal transduction histidine-protein kinase atoS [Fibrella aestuarina BUZ 2]